VWFTVANGVLSDVYGPTIDTTNVETLQYVVTDGSTFTDLQSRDMTYTVTSTDKSGMSCQVTSTGHGAPYKLVTDYITDPARDSVVMHTRLVTSTPGLKVYVRYDATVNGNGGGGPDNGGGDDASVDPATTALVSSDADPTTNAVNRTYAGPVFTALRADRPFLAETSGYAGTPSDGLPQLDAGHALTTTYATATDGNVVQTALVDTRRKGEFTLALGLATTESAAIAAAGGSAHASFTSTANAYAKTWSSYDAKLKAPPTHIAGLSTAQVARVRAAYWLSVNVVKASEDKTFPGAIVASLASPWGQAVDAGASPGGKPVYFGSYREVFSRDLYEAFTGLLAAGDVSTARAATRFLFEHQQLADGRMPRNSLVNGAKAPDTGGDQLDETSYPILMALQSGLDHDAALYTDHIKKAADFVVAHGPSFGSERWEEQGGYSPSTIAAEIAGLVAAGRIADEHGDHASARVYRATADQFQRSIKGWTVTTSGPYGGGRYFIRLSKTGDPDAALSYGLGNGSVNADQRAVVDAGFLELVRLGELPASDPDVQASLGVVDSVISRSTDSGTGFYRYGTDQAGSEDGYGDCYEPDATTCSPTGAPWPTTSHGSGHLWPVLGGERAEYDLASGDAGSAATLLRTMDAMSSGIGLVPEQAWEDPDLPASPFGSDPGTASIGFVNGQAAGSASPLTWAQAQEARLVRSLAVGSPVEQPSAVRARYSGGSVDEVPITITSPTDGTAVDSATTTVSGTTQPRARVDVAATPTDTGGATSTSTVRAGADGSWSVDVPTPLGTTVITAAAFLNGGTGYARTTVVSTFVSGTTVMDVTDPSNDDNGPGTFTYPTSGDFHPGAYDLQRFQVIDTGTDVVLRATLRDLSPTFGSPLGAQLLDVMARNPAVATTSTAAPFTSRNWTIDPGSAWTERVEVQGFADPLFVDAAGNSLGTATVQASQAAGTITVILPKSAFGTPASGWVFSVVLHGQDGFSPDQGRSFTPTAGAFSFGVCAPGGSSPICAADPNTMPKAMDVLTPAGVDQSTELDPTLGAVVIKGVPVP
jgi:glucan 1,4-alpha-glucosidase